MFSVNLNTAGNKPGGTYSNLNLTQVQAGYPLTYRYGRFVRASELPRCSCSPDFPVCFSWMKRLKHGSLTSSSIFINLSENNVDQKDFFFSLHGKTLTDYASPFESLGAGQAAFRCCACVTRAVPQLPNASFCRGSHAQDCWAKRN